MKRLKRKIKQRQKAIKRTFLLFIAKINLVSFKNSFWEKYVPSEIENLGINSDVWDINLNKLSRLNKPVKFRILRDAYWHSYVKLWLNPKIKKIEKQENNNELIKEQLKFIQEQYDLEKKRQEVIDSKAKQIISNAGIILTLIGIASTIYLDDKYAINIELNIWIVIATVFLFLFSLLGAIFVLDFKKYYRPSEDLVLKEYTDCNSFIKNRLTQLLIPLKENMITNTKKTKQLKISTILFVFALIGVCSLIILNVYTLNKINTSEDKIIEVKITEPIKIEGNKTINISVTDTLEINCNQGDTLKIKMMK